MTYLYLGGLFSIICLLAVGMFIAANVHYWVKLVLSPILIVLALHLWAVSVAVLGYPVGGYPQDGAVMLAVAVSKPNIFFWIKEKDGPRGYVVPYSESLGKQIAEAQSKAAASHGVMIFHATKKKGKGAGGNSNGGGEEEGGGNSGNASGNGKGGTKAAGYGAAPGFDDDASVAVTIDVVPSLPQK